MGLAWSKNLGCSDTIVSNLFWKAKVGIASSNPKSMQGDQCFGKSSHTHLEKLDITSESRGRGWKELECKRQYNAMEGIPPPTLAVR